MRTIIFTLFILIICRSISYGQKQFITMDSACLTITSNFDKVIIMDNRSDTANFGFIQTGAFNKYLPVKFEVSFTEELKAFHLNAIKKASKQNATLIINIGDFHVSEKTGGMSESGSFRFSANYFISLNGYSYIKILTIDTTYINKSSWDVSQPMLRGISEHLCENLKTLVPITVDTVNHEAFTVDMVQKFDSLEKIKIPLYNVAVPAKGIYYTFEQLKNNQPADTLFIKEIKEKVYFYHSNAEGKKGKKISGSGVYAVCDGTRLYKFTRIGIYDLKKESLDYYFTGKFEGYADEANVAAAGIMFGIIGAAIASSNSADSYKFKLDYRNGTPIPVKKIK